jgi:beta-lactamase class A
MRIRILLLLLALLLTGCERSDPGSLVAASQFLDAPVSIARPTATLSPAAATPAIGETPSAITTTTLIPTPVPQLSPSPERPAPACGQLLPAVPPPTEEVLAWPAFDEGALAHLMAIVPPAAEPALQRILDAPERVGLVAYQMGQEDQGVFLNPDALMPLASVVKTIHLVAYVEAVAAGELNPLESVPLEALETYYLPNSDLGAHNRALAELEENGRILATDPPSLLLEDIPWMMIRHSSNAATDYLQQRLGQVRVEQTVRQLGLNQQTAPCPFLGQFLLMANHTRTGDSDVAFLNQYLAWSTGSRGSVEEYGRDVALLTDAFQSNALFRQEELAWRERHRRPSLDTQRFFSEHFNAQGTAREYAALMIRLAQNGLSNADSSYYARRYLEWPMRFPVNQELFSNLGYKGGSLPGILTGAYYTYRYGEVVPVVVVLFYRELSQQVYRRWLRDVPHDELARWLLADPEAIPAMRAALAGE